LIRVCAGFIAGLSCLFWLETIKQSTGLLLTSSILVIFLFFLSNPQIKKLIPLVMGLIWGSAAVCVWLMTIPDLLSVPKTVSIQGYVCSLPVKNNLSSHYGKPAKSIRLSFDFCVTKIEQQQLSFYQANKLRLSIYQATPEQLEKILAGSYWQFYAKLKPIHGRLNPGGFDYEKWLVSEGFIGSGYVKTVLELPPSFSIKASLHALRQRIFSSLNQVIPANDSKGMILALAIGERSSISAEQWQAIKNSGTSHLLAISGLHIGIAAMWSYYFCLFIFSRLRFVIQTIPAQKLAEVASLLGAITIALLSGFGYPAQRALIMLAVFLYTRWSGRHLSLANILAISVILITIIQPFAVLTVSFWLSVLAVVIIVFLLSYKQMITKGPVKIQEWLRINWFLFVGLMPITWVVFDSISIVGFLANLLLIPLTSFITTPLVYIGLLSLMLSHELASWLFYLADKVIALTFQIQLILSQTNNLISVSSLPVVLFVLLFVATLLILLPAKMPGKTLLLPIVLLSVLSLSQSDQQNKFKMVVFDIGQGLAIHISVGDKHLLYDTGYGNIDFSMAQTSLLPYFKRKAVSRLERLIISHGDADHAGGINAITDDLEIGVILAGEEIPQPHNNCHNIKPWRWDKVEFSFLPHLLSQTGNNSSCVLKIAVGTRKILLTGDIEKQAERQLLKNGLDKYQIVIAPHHGSLSSSTVDFVNRTRPEVVLFSSGYANQWQFPKTEVVKRYLDVGAKILVTHTNGAIIVEQNSVGELDISTERSNRPHFWQINQTE
jgi:competence protein ComEC